MSNTCLYHFQFSIRQGDDPYVVIRELDQTLYSNRLTFAISAMRRLLLGIFSGQIRISSESYATPPLSWLTGLDSTIIDFNQPIDNEATTLLKRIATEPLTSYQEELIAYVNRRPIHCASEHHALSMRYALQLFQYLNLDYVDAITVNMALAISSPVQYVQCVPNPNDRYYQFSLQQAHPRISMSTPWNTQAHSMAHNAHYGSEWLIAPYCARVTEGRDILISVAMPLGGSTDSYISRSRGDGLLLIPGVIFWHSAQLRSN